MADAVVSSRPELSVNNFVPVSFSQAEENRDSGTESDEEIDESEFSVPGMLGTLIYLSLTGNYFHFSALETKKYTFSLIMNVGRLFFFVISESDSSIDLKCRHLNIKCHNEILQPTFRNGPISLTLYLSFLPK